LTKMNLPTFSCYLYDFSMLVVGSPQAQSATLYGQNLKLTSAEFEILNLLVNNICQVVTRDQCCQLFRGIDYAFNDRSIDMRVSGLRRKLRIHAKDKQLIRTVRNKGYMLVA
ncbi:helix-turn-helix domain-containing protein, partial [uncultured Vibrio sp.]|uniref:helix-turn-helix domain-containing protein n=1 Tax=uncultured Vibrio sp. TaxID=114054 RepID=UPI002625B810